MTDSDEYADDRDVLACIRCGWKQPAGGNFVLECPDCNGRNWVALK